MSLNSEDNEDRKTMLIRFVTFYTICVLCITVPLYYLFNIPDYYMGNFKEDKPSNKNEQVKLDSIQSIINKLDGYMNENKYENEYKNGCLKLFNYANDSLDKDDPYKPFLIKVSNLYVRIGKIYEDGGKEEIEKLKNEIEEKDKEILKLEDDLRDEKLKVEIEKIRNNN